MDFPDFDVDLDGGEGENSGNAAEITRLATELAEERQKTKELENEKAEMKKHFDYLKTLEGKAPEMEAEIAKLKGEIKIKEDEVASYKRRMDELNLAFRGAMQPFDDAKQTFLGAAGTVKELTKQAHGITEDAKAIRQYKDELKRTREQMEQGDDGGAKGFLLGLAKYALIGVFLFTFCWFGAKRAIPADELKGLHDMVWRIAYNQIYMPWGSFISPYISRDEATRIINEQYKSWREQEQQPKE
jgi:hypothetical protein